MPLLTPVVRSRSGCWMATLDPHLLVLAWIHPSVRPVLAAVYRWRRRSHGSVGLGILLAVPLVLANLVHPSLVGLVVDGRNSWVAPIRLVALSTLSSLDTVAQTLERCSILLLLVAPALTAVLALGSGGPPSLVTGGPPAPGVWWWMILAPIFLGVLLFDPGMVLNGGRNGLDRYRSGPTWRRVCIGRVALWASTWRHPWGSRYRRAALVAHLSRRSE